LLGYFQYDKQYTRYKTHRDIINRFQLSVDFTLKNFYIPNGQ